MLTDEQTKVITDRARVSDFYDSNLHDSTSYDAGYYHGVLAMVEILEQHNLAEDTVSKILEVRHGGV